MIEFKIPVTVGHNERLINSIDSIFELHDAYFLIKTKYKLERPKDADDKFSEMETVFCDFNQIILVHKISSIYWMWDRVDKCYIIDIIAYGKGIAWNMADKNGTVNMYDKIVEWWLSKQQNE